MNEVPLYGTCKTVEARHWPWPGVRGPYAFFESTPLRLEVDTATFLIPAIRGDPAEVLFGGAGEACLVNQHDC